MIAVPATKTTQDILQFLGPVSLWLEHIRIIRDSTPNQYMVLMKFRNQKYAVDFFQNFNGKSWNSLESEAVHLLYTSAVELLTSSEGGSLPVVGTTELPTCPVCLERMDESVDSILTILCSHSFHGSCLVKWTDTSCPVCRYIQTPEQDQESLCVQCDARQDLWICLICGHVGCGRYLEGHAYEHYKLTHHTYSMQLGANRVWDYAGDSYVHRLVQSSGDGKIVQVMNESETSADDKNDALQLEYTYILTSQLETQRLYFQEKLDQIESESKKHQDDLKEAFNNQERKLHEVLNRMDRLEKEKKSLEQKNASLSTQVNRSKKDLEEEKQYNLCLRKNQDEWSKKCAKLEETIKRKDTEIQSLEEQVRDVMFSLDAQMKLKEEATEEELRSSSMSVDASAPQRSQRRKSRKK
ncbi:DgyrCDS6546 [Dimorphilus gyrociliatus]|nr:DgyrCDS6546 [Dimorphilus gyrociliatus]